MKKISKEIKLTLDFVIGKQDVKRGIFEGGVKSPEALE